MLCPLCDEEIGDLEQACDHVAYKHREMLIKPHYWFACPCGVIVTSAATSFTRHCAVSLYHHLQGRGVTDLIQHVLESL